MNMVIKCLTVVILILCLISSIHVIAYYANGSTNYYDARDITSEGPQARTARWYLAELLCDFDDAVVWFCKTIGNDRPLIEWRSWLQERWNITMY